MNEIQTRAAAAADDNKICKEPLLGWKNILAAVDFCELSREALKTAVGLAAQSGAKLTVLHIVHVPASYSMDALPGVEELMISARETMERICDKIPPGVVQQKLVQFGKQEIVREIVDAALELPADLIVIATHGRGGLARVLHSSIAERVVRQSPCPVLVVHARGDDPQPVQANLENQNPVAKAAH